MCQAMDNKKLTLRQYGRPSPAPRSAKVAAEDADDFEMRAVPELVHRRHPFQAVSAGSQDRGVAREGSGVAGHARHDRNRRGRQLPNLGSGARRIERHGVEAGEFRAEQRTTEQIAGLDREPLEAGGRAPRAVEGGEGERVAIDRMDLGGFREA